MNSRTISRERPLPSQALQRRNALVEDHRHLVLPLARHYQRRCLEPQDDLIQVGLLGLIRAAELFCPSLQTPFAAFARPHIRGAILHYLRDEAPAVRLPRRQCELQSRVRQLEERLAGAAMGQAAAEGEILRLLAITAEQRHLLQRHTRLCRPAPLEPELMEQLASPGEEGQEDPQGGEERVEALLAALDPRTRQVVRQVVLQGWSYRRTAAMLEVSAMTVQRCLHRGLATLRGMVAGGGGTCGAAPALNPGPRVGPVPSGARGWPSQHSPRPAGAPAHRARR